MEKLLLAIPEAAQVLGVGRSRLYELMADGDVESVHIGRRRLVPADALEAYARKLRDEQRVAQ